MNTTEKTAVWRLVEKVERAGVIRLTGAMKADDWKELAGLAAECREMLVADTIAAAGGDKCACREELLAALEGLLAEHHSVLNMAGIRVVKADTDSAARRAIRNARLAAMKDAKGTNQ